GDDNRDEARSRDNEKAGSRTANEPEELATSPGAPVTEQPGGKPFPLDRPFQERTHRPPALAAPRWLRLLPESPRHRTSDFASRASHSIPGATSGHRLDVARLLSPLAREQFLVLLDRHGILVRPGEPAERSGLRETPGPGAAPPQPGSSLRLQGPRDDHGYGM